MWITLTPRELLLAATVGVYRHVEARATNARPAHGLDVNGPAWDYGIEGCCGELAVAKALGLYWTAVSERGAADVGDYQVRTAARQSYRLIVHETDPDDAVFVLVLGRSPTFEIAGWILGIDAKVSLYWTDPGTGRPAFFVPREVLRPIEVLAARAIVLDDLDE